MSQTSPSNEGTVPTPPQETTSKPRRKWRRRLLVLVCMFLVLIAVLVLAAPTIASIPAVQKQVLGYVNGSLRGQLAADRVALSWFGPMEVAGFSLTDPQQNEVVAVKRIAVTTGIWQAAMNGLTWGELAIESPQVALVLDENGRPSIIDAIAERQSTPPDAAGNKPAGELPQLAGRLKLTDGSVTVSREGFEPYHLSHLNMDVDVQSLNKVTGSVNATLDDDKPLAATFDLADIVSNGVIDVEKLTGKASIDAGDEFDVGRLLALLTGEQGYQGRMKLSADVAAQPGDLRVEANAGIVNLLNPHVGDTPVSLSAGGNLNIRGKNVEGEVSLTGKAQSFIHVKASGTTDEMVASIESDLAALHKELAGAVNLSGVDFSGAATGTLTVKKAARVLDSELHLGIDRPALQTGEMAFSAERVKIDHAGSYDSDSGELRTTGEFAAEGGTVSGRRVEGKLAVAWQNVRTGKVISAESVALSTDIGNLSAQRLAFDTERSTVTDGTIDLTADLGKAWELAGTRSDKDGSPSIKGRASIRAAVTAEGEDYRIRGDGTIDGLAFSNGEQTVEEEQVRLTLDAAFKKDGSRVRLGENQVASSMLNVTLGGEIADPAGSTDMQLNGRYELDWPKMLGVAEQFSPGLSALVVIEGKSRGDFQVAGRPNQPDAKPPFRGLTAGTAINWDQARVLGLDVPAVAFAPRLADGRLHLPETSMQIARGKLNLRSELDMTGEEPTLRVPGNLAVLDGIPVTPQLAQDLLSRINPIFLQFMDVQGTINLRTTDVELPLGPSMTSGGAGSGALDLIDMKVRAAGFVPELLALGGVAGTKDLLAVRVEGAKFVIAQGRLSYEDFALIFPEEFDVRFRGSVGFDDSLDLVVSIPIRPDLLKRLGIAGDVQKYADALAGSRVDIPLVGTRENPQLDVGGIDSAQIMEQLLKAGLSAQLGEALDGAGKNAAESILGGGKNEDGKPGTGLEGLLPGKNGGKPKSNESGKSKDAAQESTPKDKPAKEGVNLPKPPLPKKKKKGD